MGWYYGTILAVLLLGSRGFAYPTPYDVDGQLHRWPITETNSTIYYNVISSDPTLQSFLETVVDSASELWNESPASAITLASNSGGETPQVTVYYDASISGGDVAAGYTIFDEINNTTPVHCSIHIAVGSSFDLDALNKTTLHELGHSIGLAHSVIPQSIMSYYLTENSFALSVDDHAAMARLYPQNSSHAHIDPGCTIGADRPHSRNYGSLLILMAIPVILGTFSRVYAPKQRSKLFCEPRRHKF